MKVYLVTRYSGYGWYNDSSQFNDIAVVGVYLDPLKAEQAAFDSFSRDLTGDYSPEDLADNFGTADLSALYQKRWDLADENSPSVYDVRPYEVIE